MNIRKTPLPLSPWEIAAIIRSVEKNEALEESGKRQLLKLLSEAKKIKIVR